MPSGHWQSGRRGASWWGVLTGFSSLVALASGVSDGIQKLGSVLSLSLPAAPALRLGWASSTEGKGVPMLHLGKYLALG